ncbi:hypothetical protein TcCL_NonESM12382 [Trypanosoma cruzi]|nr:hypothetical protein TcCL_NonESM12382 [Trypanosoma cruzi]
MPRGGRHAGGAHTAPSGTQGRPRNSPDYYYFGNRWGDGGGSPPLGRTSIGAYRRLDRRYTHCRVEKRCDIVGSPSASQCGQLSRILGGGTRIGRYALHLSGGAVWSNSSGGIPE